MRRLLLALLALTLAAPALAQIYPGYGTPTLLGDGTSTAPSYSWASSPTDGIFKAGASEYRFVVSAGNILWRAWFPGAVPTFEIGPGGRLSFDSGASDAFLQRQGVGTLGLTSGGSTSTYSKLGGVLFLEANNVAQSATSQNLHAYTVPASVMAVTGKTLRVTALFLTVNNANAKAVGFVICGGSLTFNATASIAGALRATAYITRTAVNTWTTSVTIEEGLASGTLTQAKLSGTYNSTPACTDTATNTINAAVNTAGATDTSSGFFMVELLN